MTFAKINEKMEPCTSKKIKRQKARKCHRQTTIIFGLFKHSLTPKELKKKITHSISSQILGRDTS